MCLTSQTLYKSCAYLYRHSVEHVPNFTDTIENVP